MPDDIDSFFDTFTADVADISRALRDFIKLAQPDAPETAHLGWKVVSYGHKTKFCAIAPHKAWVNLQFHAGTSLDDPTGLLEGTGKSIRHIKLRSHLDLTPEVTDLLQQSAKLAR